MGRSCLLAIACCVFVAIGEGTKLAKPARLVVGVTKTPASRAVPWLASQPYLFRFLTSIFSSRFCAPCPGSTSTLQRIRPSSDMSHARSHYGDPRVGCMPEETDITIEGTHRPLRIPPPHPMPD